MTVIVRRPKDFLFGTLQTAAAVSDTSISSTAFANLPTDYSTGLVLPLILLNPSLGTFEVVWATGHTSGSQTVTVVRGKEGTTAQAWPSGTQVICAPTASRDALGTFVSTSAPTDLHVGARNVVTDKGVVQEQTNTAGLQPSVGMANPGDVGVNRAGTAPPATSTIIVRSGYFSGTTDSSGKFTVPFQAPFPNACMAAVVMNAAANLYPLVLTAESPTGLTIQVYQYTSFGSGSPLTSGFVIPIMYFATGY